MYGGCMVEVGRRGVEGRPEGGTAFPSFGQGDSFWGGSHNSHLTVLRQMLTLRSQPISNLGSLAMPASLPSTPLLAIPQDSFKFARRAKKAKMMPANPREKYPVRDAFFAALRAAVRGHTR